jgi:hypothetical protein
MIEFTTQLTNSLGEPEPETVASIEELGEEEQSFYSSIVPDLNALLENPKPETLGKIMDYSKSI